MTPETADMIVWAAGISNLVALGTTIWNMVSSGTRANAKTLDEHARRLEMIERQIELAAVARRDLEGRCLVAGGRGVLDADRFPRGG